MVSHISLAALTPRRPAQTYLLLLYFVPKDAVKEESSGRRDSYDRRARLMMHRNR